MRKRTEKEIEKANQNIMNEILEVEISSRLHLQDNDSLDHECQTQVESDLHE